MRRTILTLILLCTIILLPAKSASKYDDFFQKTRFIMSKEEIEIFRHLPDDQAKEEFISEFWEKRDPNPATPENEAYQEYQQRIEFANRYFKENRPYGYGWNTDRGRIVLQLGIPEKRYFQGMYQSGQIEVFFYESYQLMIEFIDRFGNGEYTLYNPPAQLLSVLDTELKNLNSFSSDKRRNYLTYEAEYRSDSIWLQIPVKRITFQEEEAGNLHAELELTIFIYLDYKKIDTLTIPIAISEKTDEVLNKKYLTYSYPLKLEQKGKYVLDLILREKITNSRFRQILSLKR